MDDRLYFQLGDYFTCILSGWVVAVFSAWFFDPSWGMFSAMFIGMVLGMAVGFVFPGAILIHFFGLFEIMVPLMITIMMVGMVVSMLASMFALSFGAAGFIGIVIGIAVLRLTYKWNDKISGVDPEYLGFAND
ncbi:MAG: hypothetical protein JKY01_03280 [Pseudomonadales bacterium]|nr:hypothetical protein [Pseudomonadales bacterium]